MVARSLQLSIDAERQFPVRVIVAVMPGGILRLDRMHAWLDDNCGVGRWQMTPAGLRGVVNDAVAVWLREAACAASFVARWCVPGDAGYYRFREDDPSPRIPAPHHTTR